MVKLDKVDIIILKHLLQDGRASNTDIAKVVGVSDVAIKKRIDSLRTRKILQSITAVIDYSVLGYESPVFILIKTHPESTDLVISRLSQLDYVQELILTSGEYSISAKAIFRKNSDIKTMLDEISKISGIIYINPLLILAHKKETRDLPSSALQNNF